MTIAAAGRCGARLTCSGRSRGGCGGIERPVAARFNPAGTVLYVVDFGVMLMDKQGPKPQPGTGVLWRVTRDGSQ